MPDDNLSVLNPLEGIYSEFGKILSRLVIKYSYRAEESETYQSKRNADEYLAAVDKRDTFLTYRNYSYEEYAAVGISDPTLAASYIATNGYLDVPEPYRNALLKNRRAKIIAEYVEQNDYYRMLNGLPPYNTKADKFHYIPEYYANKFGIDRGIAIHQIRDYYNALDYGNGDYLIASLDGVGYIDELISQCPDEEYLKYLGDDRVDIPTARRAKNFQILKIYQSTVKQPFYDSFISTYENCRDYFMTVVFVREYRNFIDAYDRFIAMCIMLMTFQTVINKQFPLGINREYFNDYTLKLLYDAYNIPYDLSIDQYTQKRIAQNLNLLIKNKATDKVIYDIAALLGFDRIKIYKYYLSKVHKEDEYGVPIFRYKTSFNNETGMTEVVPDYEAMYNIYFQRAEIKEDDFSQTFYDIGNKIPYENIVTDDPFWWEDSNLMKQLWETEYSFVESKYLGFGISYKMSEIMLENVVLLKLLMDEKSELGSIKFTLPRIDETLQITLFDAVILLCCLISKKHHLRGEIISIPTQVISVMDYMHNVDGGDEYLVDSFAFNLKYFLPENIEGQEMISLLKKLLGKEDPTAPDTLMRYLSVISINPNLPNYSKVELINEMYSNIKGLVNYIEYKIAETNDRATYEALKTFYRAVFYAKESKELFTINGNSRENRRTANNFFEFLYYHNPKLYSIIFTTKFDEQYAAYVAEHGLSSREYTKSDYQNDIDYGRVDFDYSTLNTENTHIRITDELIYFYANHVISRIETYVKELNFLHTIIGTAAPLEKLLIRLINFFKSYTVDMVGLDTIYITDLKVDNIVRFFDEIRGLDKTIVPRDDMFVSYSDSIEAIIARFKLHDRSVHLNDKMLYSIILTIGAKLGFDDKFMSFESTIKYDKNDESLHLLDQGSIDSALSVKDGTGFDDKIKLFYS